jgi:L-ascorbate metabolism protein UlaG (beta-lactamase superfamily)
MTMPDLPSAALSTSTEGAPRRPDGRFRNVVPRQGMGLRKTLALMWTVWTQKPKTAVPDRPLPVHALTTAEIEAAPDASLWRLGHSTMLLKLDGRYWLTDPVFSERASPFQWAGPKRFHAPPIAIDDLPRLAGVILSHDHYDHLDHASILRLIPKTDLFVTPLGVGDRLVRWGADPARVRQLDWWQSTEADGLRLTAAPARHFSGRGLGDSDKTLWVSWVLDTGSLRLFFSGDGGYHDGFRTIGERCGPFDVALIENGAYNTMWPEVHMQPEETLQACLDIRARWLVPIHNGTFDLALHPWYEPFERISALARAAGLPLATPMMGERLSLAQPQACGPWWRQAMPVDAGGAAVNPGDRASTLSSR